jgi:hypothetical protein
MQVIIPNEVSCNFQNTTHLLTLVQVFSSVSNLYRSSSSMVSSIFVLSLSTIWRLRLSSASRFSTLHESLDQLHQRDMSGTYLSIMFMTFGLIFFFIPFCRSSSSLAFSRTFGISCWLKSNIPPALPNCLYCSSQHRPSMGALNVLLLIRDPRVLFFKLSDVGLTCLSILRSCGNIMLRLLSRHIQVGKNFLNSFDRCIQCLNFLVELTQDCSFTLQGRIRIRVVNLESFGRIRFNKSIKRTDLCLLQLAFHLREFLLLRRKVFVGLFDLLGRNLNISLDLV